MVQIHILTDLVSIWSAKYWERCAKVFRLHTCNSYVLLPKNPDLFSPLDPTTNLQGIWSSEELVKLPHRMQASTPRLWELYSTDNTVFSTNKLQGIKEIEGEPADEHVLKMYSTYGPQLIHYSNKQTIKKKMWQWRIWSLIGYSMMVNNYC